MRKLKTLISLLLVLCMAATLAPGAFAAEIAYPVLEDGSGNLKNQAEGGDVLFSSDIHQNHTYFESVLQYLLAQPGYEDLGLIAIGGDYENGHANTLETGVTNALINYANAANIPIVLTKGNHELATDDADFLAATGSIRAGHTATGFSNDGDELYHLYSFGAFTDEGSTSSYVFDIGQSYYNGTQLVLDPSCELAQLDAFMSTHTDDPVYVLSHYPLHYYNDRRVIKGARMVIDVLNQYPNAIFLWGHNHTEGDPMYGKILTEGDVIMPYAPGTGTGLTDSAGNEREILFTYVSLGATKTGTIYNVNAVHASASTDGINDTVVFNYLTHNDTKEVAFVSGSEDVNSPTTVVTSKDATATVYALNLDVPEPVYGQAPATTADVGCYSTRYSVTDISWNPNPATFDYGTMYTAAIDLEAANGVTFASSLIATVNGEEANVMISGNTAKITFVFEPTVTKAGDPLDAVGGWSWLNEGGVYYIASNSYGMKTDLSGARVAADGSKMTSTPGDSDKWVIEADGDGFSIRCGDTYLGLSQQGEVSLIADSAPDEIWDIDSNGYIYSDGNYLVESGGQFMVGSENEANVKLYDAEETGDIGVIAISSMQYPSADMGSEGYVNGGSGRYDFDYTIDPEFNWDAWEENLGKTFTARVTITPYGDHTVEDNFFVRCDGQTIAVEDITRGRFGSVSFTLPLGTTRSNVRPIDNDYEIDYASVSFVDGESYLISFDSRILLANIPLDEKGMRLTGWEYLIYNDSVWTATANSDGTGYYLSNGGKFLVASTDGLTLTEDMSEASVWNYDYDNSLVTQVATGGGRPSSEGGDDFVDDITGQQPSGSQGSSSSINGTGSYGTDDTWEEPPISEGGGSPPPPPADSVTMRLVIVCYLNGQPVVSVMEVDDLVGEGAFFVPYVHINRVSPDEPLSAPQVYLDRHAGSDPDESNISEDLTITITNLEGEEVDPENLGYGEYLVYLTSEKYGFNNQLVGRMSQGFLYDLNGKLLEGDGFDIFSFVVYNNNSEIIDFQYVIKGMTAERNFPDIYGPFTGVWAVNRLNFLHQYDFSQPVLRPTTLVVGVDASLAAITLLPTKDEEETSGKIDVVNAKEDHFNQMLALYMAQQQGIQLGSFSDVGSGDWFYTYVTDLSNAGIVNGYEDGSFRPAGMVTWGEALKLVMLAVDYPQLAPTGDHWASGYMDRAITAGLIDGPVDLDEAIEREELIDLSWRAKGRPAATVPSPFEDEATDAAIALYEQGIITGSADDGHLLLRGGSKLSRAEVSATIWRMEFGRVR